MIRIGLVLILFLILNLLFLDYQQFKNSPVSSDSDVPALKQEISGLKQQVMQLKTSYYPGVASSAANLACPTSCVDLIKSSASKTTTTVSKGTAIKSNPKEFVITLGSGSSNNIGSWTDIETAQATIDTSNYTSITEADFEVVMHIPNGDGEVRAKLVNTTIPYVYDGNQLSSTSSTGSLSSTPIILQPGKNVYKVQLLTTISSAVLDEARIRIVTK